MVVEKGKLTNRMLLGVCLMLAVFSNAMAAVTARVDRPSVDLNESFVLELTVDTNIDMEPDLSVLDENFYRGQMSQLSNTTIINGQIRRSRTWTVALMAKATGKQLIPAISVGNESSEPISITINEPTDAPPGEADVFITSEVDQTEAYVQSQILYRFRVYRAVATRQEGRREPVITGAEVLIERAGDERSYEAILNGRAYNVIERVLAIYPQASGEISISPAIFEARVLRDGRITGRKVFESDAHTVKVLPIPPPPADLPDAAWLPARDVALSEEWSREPNEIKAGEPVTRKVTISALGQIETQIPALEPPKIDGMNVYADKPELSRVFEAEGIRGVRRDQYAMIGVRGGTVEVPEVAIPWWDIDAGEWKVARLPSRTIDVEAPEALLVPPPAVPPADPVELAPAPPAERVPDAFWKRVSQLLGGIWVLTLLAWWWSARAQQREPREPEPPPVYRQQAKFVKAAKNAAAAGDKAGVRAALIEWGRLQWPDDAPRSIGEFAARVASPLSDELQKLSASSYGNAAPAWDGAALAQALRKITVVDAERVAAANDPLPPLMPPWT
ncbi:MAG: BatD family protein [Gammaproteobacteria bacterium]|nr:BatD family protein [Gammaproteobacteria bacterium]